MKHVGRTLLLSSLLAALTLPLPSQASGSYCACLPKPPSKKARAEIDRDQFDLGQKVFNGKTAAAQGNADSQRPRLESLQAQLPARVAKKKDLTALAGKLSPEQLDALEYFVANRYPKSK